MSFPEANQATTNYPIAVLKDAPQAQLAQQFVDLVTGDAGRQALEAAGFGPGKSSRRARPSADRRAPAVALPRLLWIPAACAFALVALPVVGLLLRADWPRMPELLTSEAALDALRLSLITAAISTRAVHRPRRAAGGRPRPRAAARAAGAALRGAAAAGAAAGRRRPRAAVPARPHGPARPAARPLVRHHDPVHDHGGRARADVRRAAVPRGQPRGGAAHGGRAVRGGRRDPRCRARLRVPARDRAARAARPGVGRGAGVRARLGEFGATTAFAGSLQGTTRTLPLLVYLERETDVDGAVALSLLLVAVAVVVIAVGRSRPTEGLS